MKRSGKLLLFCTLLTILTILCSCGKKNDVIPSGNTDSSVSHFDWQTQYDLGMRYIREGNYEEAILTFTAMIDIDPKKADVWLSLADAYIRQGEYDKALDVLNDALAATGNDPLIQAKLDEIEGGSFFNSDGELLRSITHYYDGNQVLIYTHIFDYGNINSLSAFITSYDANGNQTGRVECIYNEKGLELQGYITSGYDGRVLRITYVYDEQDRLIRRDWYDENDQISLTILTTYEGNRIIEKEITPDGEEGQTIVRETNGDTTTDSYYGPDGTLHRYSVSIAGIRGPVEHSLYDGQGTLMERTVYEYDSTEKLVGAMTYDAAGNVIAQETYE